LDRAALVGNSIGGWVAAAFAAQFPERAERLAIIDPAGFKAMFEAAPPINFDPGGLRQQRSLTSTMTADPASAPLR